VRDQLHSLLERFGPQRAQYRPDMPFWRFKVMAFGNYKMRRAVPHQVPANNHLREN
jgi:predicted restriction endonuclease